MTALLAPGEVSPTSRSQLRRDHDQAGEEERAHDCRCRDGDRPAGPWSDFVALKDSRYANMLEVTNSNQRCPAEHDHHPNTAVQHFVGQPLSARLHNQRDLRDHKAQSEQGDAGPEPCEKSAVISQLVTHEPSQPSTEVRAQSPSARSL